MLRQLFSYYNPLYYVLLLALVVVLRWPWMALGGVSDIEGYYLTAAQHSLQGQLLYAHTYISQPPLLVWLYALAQYWFGTHALLATQIFGLLYAYVCALLVIRLYNRYRLSPELSTLPGTLYVIALCVPWYAQQLTPALLLQLPMLLLLGQLVAYALEERSAWQNIFYTGVLLALCTLIQWQAVVLVAMALVAMLVLGPSRKRDMVTLLAGGATILGLASIWFFLNGQSAAFWQQLLSYTWHIAHLAAPTHAVWPEALLLWGGLALAGVLGLFYFRIRFYASPIRVRKVANALLIWQLAVVAMLLLTTAPIQVQDLCLLCVPMVMFASYWLEHALRPLWRGLVLVVLVLAPTMSYVLYHVGQDEDAFLRWQFATGGQASISHNRALILHHTSPDTLQRYLLAHPPTSLWVADGRYALYQHTHYSAALPYLEPGRLRHALHTEQPQGPPRAGLLGVYAHWQQYQPHTIIDNSGLMHQLQHHMPLLIAPYRQLVLGADTLYYLPAKPTNSPNTPK